MEKKPLVTLFSRLSQSTSCLLCTNNCLALQVALRSVVQTLLPLCQGTKRVRNLWGFYESTCVLNVYFLCLCFNSPYCSYGYSSSCSNLRTEQLLTLVGTVCAGCVMSCVRGGIREQPPAWARPTSKQKQNALNIRGHAFVHACAMSVQSLFCWKHIWLLSTAENYMCRCAWVCQVDIKFIRFSDHCMSMLGCS